MMPIGAQGLSDVRAPIYGCSMNGGLDAVQQKSRLFRVRLTVLETIAVSSDDGTGLRSVDLQALRASTSSAEFWLRFTTTTQPAAPQSGGGSRSSLA